MANGLSAVIGGPANYFVTFIAAHSYSALFFLMVLEGASLPIPSEVIVPLAGYLAAQGTISLQLAFIVILLGNVVGIAIDYSIGYFIGKKVVYEHLHRFHIKKQTIEAFDAWFNRNGVLAVFISRMIPEVRSLMSFPAGFAKMPLGKFFVWSIAGSAIWDFVLILFGYYLLSGTDALIVATAIGVFALLLYVIYRLAFSNIRKHSA